MQTPDIAAMSLSEIMSRWPATIRLFLDLRLLCVGCPIAPFHTISDACREHSMDEARFLDDIKREIGSKEDPP